MTGKGTILSDWKMPLNLIKSKMYVSLVTMLTDGKLFEKMIVNSWMAFVYANLSGVIEFVNPAAAELYGYEENELIGKHVDIFNSQLNQTTSEVITTITETGSWSGELIQKRKDGSIFDAFLTIKLLYDENGRPVGMASNSKDITEEVLSRISLRESEEHYRTLIEHAPSRIIKIDREGRIVYVNRITRYRPEEVINTEIFKFVPAESHALLRKNIDVVFNEKRETSYYITGESEKSSNEQAVYFVRIVPVVSGDQVEYGLMIFEDVTEKKKNEEAVLTKQARLSAIINNTNDIILSIDKEYRIVEFNKVLKDLVQKAYNKDLQVGMSVFETMAPQFHEDLRNIYLRVFTGENVNAVEMVKSGEKKLFFETFYNPIRGENGISGIAIFSRDVTQKVKSESDLRQALKEREVLLAEVHHRVKNNLSVISGILQLQAFHTSSEEVKRVIADCTNRIKTTALVHEKLYENNSLSYINFKSYISDLAGELKRSYSTEQKKVNLECNCEEIQIDLKRAIPCGLLLNELVTNAYKHAFTGQEQGNISINVSTQNEKIFICVADDGKGFRDPEKIENADSTGMLLIKTFSSQLDADLKIVNSPNTSVTVSFNH